MIKPMWKLTLDFLSRCGLSFSSSPPLARAVFLIFDNDDSFEAFVNKSLPVPDINLESIHPELDVFRPGPNFYSSHAKQSSMYGEPSHPSCAHSVFRM